MKIRFVDGFRIRNSFDIGFNDLDLNRGKFSRYSNKHYIPRGEIWIDHVYKKSGEIEFLLKTEKISEAYFRDPKHTIIEKMQQLWQRSSKDISQRRMYKVLDLRKKLIEELCIPGPIPPFVEKEARVNNIKVVYVNGKIIRQHFDPQFIQGGHDLVYSYIPKDEIWVDVVNDSKELRYIMIHEKIEQNLMRQGKNYDIAHEYALVAEKEARRLDEIGKYPGDENYPWTNIPNQELLKMYYV